jgi:hypothetical protein
MKSFSSAEFLDCEPNDIALSFKPDAGPSEELMQRWMQNGYLHLRGILSRRLIANVELLMRESLALLQDGFLQSTGKRLDHPRTMNRLMDGSADSDAWYETIPRDLQHLVRGEYPLHVRTNPKLMLPASEERLTHLLRALLGTERLRMHYPPMLRFKMPGVEQALVPLHQDAPYFAHLGNFINVWFPLCPVDGECGGVEVFCQQNLRRLQAF